MGTDEKNQQIGVAVNEYQAAKVECGHIDRKIATVFAAYLDAGSSMDKQRGSVREPQLANCNSARNAEDKACQPTYESGSSSWNSLSMSWS